jgi:endonuclease G, mitochondrial
MVMRPPTTSRAQSALTIPGKFYARWGAMSDGTAESTPLLGRGEDERSEMSTGPADYDGRPGFDTDFLGDGHFIPLPSVTGAHAADVVEVVGGGSELRFWTYSSVMSRSRRLPFLSAANFDRTTKDQLARPTVWVLDPRLDDDLSRAKNLQVGDSWYKHQNSSGLGRGPFDRGHLTAFENATWGAEPLRNGTDTFHFSNCAPQASAFNEHEVWREIEVWAAGKGSGAVSIFNGPVFDAPPSAKGEDDLYQLNSFDPGTPDPTLQGIAIPKQFFKVAAYVEDDTLKVQAFVVTQESYFEAIEDLETGEEAISEAELALYRVPIATVIHLTGIDFGVLADEGVVTNEAVAEPELVVTLEDLHNLD